MWGDFLCNFFCSMLYISFAVDLDIFFFPFLFTSFVLCESGRLDWSDGRLWAFACGGAAWDLAWSQGERLNNSKAIQTPSLFPSLFSEGWGGVILNVNCTVIGLDIVKRDEWLPFHFSLSFYCPLSIESFSISLQGMVYSAEYIKKKLEQEMILSQAFGRDLVRDSVYSVKYDWCSRDSV